MATNIETLIKPNGDQVLPRTRAKAVFMEDGSTVETKIANLNNFATKDYVDSQSELPIIYQVTLEEPVDSIIIQTDNNGNVIDLSEWEIYLYVPTDVTYKVPFYIYVIPGDTAGFHGEFVSNDGSAKNVAMYKSVYANFTLSQYSKWETPTKEYYKFWPKGVQTSQIRLYTYNNSETPFPTGTYLEVRGK